MPETYKNKEKHLNTRRSSTHAFFICLGPREEQWWWRWLIYRRNIWSVCTVVFKGSHICIGVLLAFQKFMAIIKAMLSLNMMTTGRIRKVPPLYYYLTNCCWYDLQSRGIFGQPLYTWMKVTTNTNLMTKVSMNHIVWWWSDDIERIV